MKIKTKYDVLSKTDKKKMKKEYYLTPRGQVVKKALFMSRMCSIFCIMWGVAVLIENIIKEKSLVNYVYVATVFIFGTILLFMAHNVYLKKINFYIVNKEKK